MEIKIPVSEIFLPVPGYEGLYEVSNYGTLKRLPTTIYLKNNTTRFQPGKIKRPTMTEHYLKVYLYKDGKGKEFTIHRLVALTFLYNDNPKEKTQVNHKDGNKLNNFVNNLEWCTPLENTTHAIRTGLRNTKGENNPAAVLTEQVARDIKQMKIDGYNFKQVRAKYKNYCYATIYDCYKNRTWQGLERR